MAQRDLPRKKFDFAGIDDLLQTKPTDRAVNLLPVDALEDFPEHFFRLYQGDRMQEMVQSIKEQGVLVPLVVWKKENQYLILSGHNRKTAAKLAGLQEVPVVLKENLSEDEARLIVTSTNFLQRSFADLSHTERARSIRQHYDALKRQGRRSDLTDFGVDTESSRNKTSSEFGLSPDQIKRYVRVSMLTDALLQRVDQGQIKISAAYQLAFLSEVSQERLLSVIQGHKVSEQQAKSIREAFENNPSLSEDELLPLLEGKKKKDPSLRIPKLLLTKYFSGMNPSEALRHLEAALYQYFESIRKETN